MIYPPTYDTWRKVLNRFRFPDKSKFKFTLVTQPYSCAICDRAVKVTHKWQKACKRAKYYEDNTWTVPPNASAQQKREAELQWHRDTRKNLQDLAKAQADYDILEDHQRLYVTQRRFLVNSELDLPSRTALVFKIIVYQDYVAQYDHNGRKCSNLVFTIVWRDEQGQLRRKYVDNFCTQRKVKGCQFKGNKTDSHYTVMVWKRHLELNKVNHMLQRSNLSDQEKKMLTDRVAVLMSAGLDEFDGVTHILRTGDSGAHFHNKYVAYFESSVYEVYGIEWETHTLCKRHAYNLCDAHGGAGKRHAKAAAVAGHAPESAQEFAALLNGDRSSFGDTKAFAIEDIPRPDTSKQIRPPAGIQRCCEFQYFYTSKDGKKVREIGVMRMRRCSGVDEIYGAGQYTTCDMNKRKDRGPICHKCTYTKQRPVYHKYDQTKCTHKAKSTGSMHGQRRLVATKTPNEALQEFEQARLARIANDDNEQVALRVLAEYKQEQLQEKKQKTKLKAQERTKMKAKQKQEGKIQEELEKTEINSQQNEEEKKQEELDKTQVKLNQ